MRWEDESYVKLYVRDTPTWKAMNWQARCVWPLLMRKLDKAGLLECGSLGRGAVALMVELPEDVVMAGLQSLEKLGVIEWHDSTLVAPKFEEAQEATKTDLLRKRDQRARARDKAKAEALKSTPPQPPESIQGVSRGVTSGHEVSRAVPLQTPQPSPDTPAQLDLVAPAKKPRAPGDTRLERLTAQLVAVWLEAKGSKYGHRGAPDAEGLKRVMGFTDDDAEIVARWRLAISCAGFKECASFAELAAKWNHHAKSTAPPTRAGNARDVTRGMVRAQDVDKSSFEKVGVVNDF